MSESKPRGNAPNTESKPRRSYTEEFKREAVRLAIERKNVSAVARDLGLENSVLSRWKHAWLEAQGSTNLKAFPGKGNPRDEEFVGCTPKTVPPPALVFTFNRGGQSPLDERNKYESGRDERRADCRDFTGSRQGREETR